MHYFSCVRVMVVDKCSFHEVISLLLHLVLDELADGCLLLNRQILVRVQLSCYVDHRHIAQPAGEKWSYNMFWQQICVVNITFLFIEALYMLSQKSILYIGLL